MTWAPSSTLEAAGRRRGRREGGGRRREGGGGEGKGGGGGRVERGGNVSEERDMGAITTLGGTEQQIGKPLSVTSQPL